MAAPEVLTRLVADGITLAVDGTRLLATPAAALTDEHRALIRSNKPALVRLLTEPDPAPVVTPAPGAHRLWQITEPDGTAWLSSFTPPANLGEIQERYPGAVVEPDPPGAEQSEDPRTELYRRWLASVTEPRVLLTLDDAQVREAVAAGVVSLDLARGSVLLLVRVPGGEAEPGACGVLAIPREKYRDFSPANALEAMSWQH